MLVHGRSEGLFSLDIQKLRTRYSGSSMASAAWLPLYEIERKGWDPTPSFSKIGTGSDPGALYSQLALANVEFYRIDPDVFGVSSFSGWGLSNESFEPVRRRYPLENFEMEFLMYGQDEVYE